MSPRWFVDFRMDRRLQAVLKHVRNEVRRVTWNVGWEELDDEEDPEDLAATNVGDVIDEGINDIMVEALNV